MIDVLYQTPSWPSLVNQTTTWCASQHDARNRTIRRWYWQGKLWCIWAAGISSMCSCYSLNAEFIR